MKKQTVWSQLNIIDTDPATFFHYIGLALSAFLSRDTETKTVHLPRYQPEDAAALSHFPLRFFHPLYEQCSGHFLIVFDNYHYVPDESPNHDIVMIGLMKLPRHSQAILLNRKPPPSLFSTMQLKGTMHLVAWQELSLTVQEVKKFLCLRRNRSFTDNDAKILHQKTNGWIAGLSLLIEELSPTKAHPMSLQNHHLQSVFSYFADEILQRESQRHKEVLFFATLFKYIILHIVERLSDKSGVTQYLLQLCRKNYFTRSLQDTPILTFIFNSNHFSESSCLQRV